MRIIEYFVVGTISSVCKTHCVYPDSNYFIFFLQRCSFQICRHISLAVSWYSRKSKLVCIHRHHYHRISFLSSFNQYSSLCLCTFFDTCKTKWYLWINKCIALYTSMWPAVKEVQHWYKMRCVATTHQNWTIPIR